MFNNKQRLELDKRIHNQREQLKWWDNNSNSHAHAISLHRNSAYFKKVMTQSKEIRKLKSRITELETSHV